MENGSFHTSPGTDAQSPQSTSRVQQADELVKGIPLPNQLPRSLDFTGIPATALKSSTLETLISQNEDLMSRLSVNLRKTNQLEESVALFEKENSSLRHKFETIREQFLILQEKDQRAGSRVEKLRDENSGLKATMPKLEKLYSDLFVQAQGFQRRLVHLERYRKRIQKASRSVQSRAKFADALELRMKEMALSHIETAHSHSLALTQHTQTVRGYEAKIADVRQEIESLRSKAADRDQIFEEKVRLENQVVFEQRQYHSTREEARTEILRLEQEGTRLRLELKNILVTQEAERLELNGIKCDLPGLHEEKRNLHEQIESLQVLWTHKQRELEQLDEKNRSLQKLNQTISLTLNEQRKEIQTLKNQVETVEYRQNETIKKLLAEIQMLRRQMISEGLSLP